MRPIFSLSLDSPGFGGTGRLRRRALVVTVAGLGVGVGAGVLAHARRGRNRDAVHRPKLSKSAVEAVAGALGEMVQLCLLYPLDTIKVRCQAQNAPVGAIVRDLFRNGIGPRLVRQLYAGIGGAMLCAVLVGSIHLSTYEAAKRWLTHVMAKTSDYVAHGGHGASARASAAAAAATVASATPQTASAPAAAEAKKAGWRNRSSRRGKGSEAAAAAAAAGSTSEGGAAAAAATSGAAAAPPPPHLPGNLRLAANVAAAMAAAACTALFESPVELFRHNAQAGLAKGGMLGNMVGTLRRGGPGALYFGFWAYCFDAWPHDVTELVTYGQLRDVHHHHHHHHHHRAADAAAAPLAVGTAASSSSAAVASAAAARLVDSSDEEAQAAVVPRRPLLARLPDHVLDLGTGACAGAAAVLLSMPFDVIKTHMQLFGGDLGSMGLGKSAGAFVATGQRLVAQHGVGALYAGLVPRLMQQVPSAMVCWWSIEACKRALMPLTQ